jgi:hypothetical protein
MLVCFPVHGLAKDLRQTQKREWPSGDPPDVCLVITVIEVLEVLVSTIKGAGYLPPDKQERNSSLLLSLRDFRKSL